MEGRRCLRRSQQRGADAYDSWPPQMLVGNWLSFPVTGTVSQRSRSAWMETSMHHVLQGEPAFKGPTVVCSHQVLRYHCSRGDPVEGKERQHFTTASSGSSDTLSQVTLYCSARDSTPGIHRPPTESLNSQVPHYRQPLASCHFK